MHTSIDRIEGKTKDTIFSITGLVESGHGVGKLDHLASDSGPSDCHCVGIDDTRGSASVCKSDTEALVSQVLHLTLRAEMKDEQSCFFGQERPEAVPSKKRKKEVLNHLLPCLAGLASCRRSR